MTATILEEIHTDPFTETDGLALRDDFGSDDEYIPEKVYELIDWQSINANQRVVDVENTLTEDGTPLSAFSGKLTPQTIFETDDNFYFSD